MLRFLFIFLISILGFQCAKKPYQPNYNGKTSHNNTVKTRNQIVQREANSQIKAANKLRKNSRKARSAKSLNKQSKKDSKKLIR